MGCAGGEIALFNSMTAEAILSRVTPDKDLLPVMASLSDEESLPVKTTCSYAPPRLCVHRDPGAGVSITAMPFSAAYCRFIRWRSIGRLSSLRETPATCAGSFTRHVSEGNHAPLYCPFLPCPCGGFCHARCFRCP